MKKKQIFKKEGRVFKKKTDAEKDIAYLSKEGYAFSPYSIDLEVRAGGDITAGQLVMMDDDGKVVPYPTMDLVELQQEIPTIQCAKCKRPVPRYSVTNDPAFAFDVVRITVECHGQTETFSKTKIEIYNAVAIVCFAPEQTERKENEVEVVKKYSRLIISDE